MKNRPKYKKTPFAEWKADKPDWQTQLIGHKILYGFNQQEGFHGIFEEIVILDYEPTNNVFYISENDEKAGWKTLEEKWITHILEEIEYDAEKIDTKTVIDQKEFWEKMKKLGEKTSPPETIPYIPPYNPPPRPRLWDSPPLYPPPSKPFYPGPYDPYWEWNKPWCQQPEQSDVWR